jgi:hypothetical protein
MWALARTGRPLGPSLGRAAGFGAVLVAALLIGGWTALGVALGLSFGVMMAPSIWVAFRTPNPSGIAPGTWWLGLAEGLLWGLYGWHHADEGILTFSAIAIAGSVLMLGRSWATRPAVSADPAAPTLGRP